MKTVGKLLHKLYEESPLFAARFDKLKTQNPQIRWYPHRSIDKVHLISMVANYFDKVEVGFLSERPKIVDVGAADGDLSFLFESVGCDVVAIDNPPSNYNDCIGIRSMKQIISSNVTLVEKDIDYDFSIDGQYDLILFLDILYHLRNPLGTLISLCQFGRYLILTTRIFEAAVNGKPVTNAPYAYLLAPFEAAQNDPTNYWMFTEIALERLLQRSGWQILNRVYFGYNGNDSSPFDPKKDKRVVCLCERVQSFEKLKYGHVIGSGHKDGDVRVGPIIMHNRREDKPTLVGHPFAPIGMGEHIRCSFRAFQSAGVTLPLRDIYSLDGRADPDLAEEFGNHLVHRLSPGINLFHINGDEVEQALGHIGNELPAGAYNIIYPMWELSIYPPEWAKQLARFDEIWTPSKFVFDSISKAVSTPVFHMPLATDVRLTSFLGRRYFGLPENSYLFLFYFDFRAWIDRKNPFAAIEALEKVCAARPGEDIRLVIKLNRPAGSSPWEADFPRFMKAIEQSNCADNVIVIDKILTDNEIKNLVRCCDCFVSLHRSEGYGKGLAEAMFLGKPVIATDYSGNLDFMNETNSCLVRYNLINVEEGQYPYAKGQVWAEPDIDHAVHYILKLLDDREYGRRLGAIASRHIRTYFSYKAIGLRYKNRLEEILQKTGLSMNIGNA